MTNIVSQYRIHEQTLALIPAAHPDYRTTVIEPEQHIHVQRTPIELLKQSCLEHGSTYDGRRNALMQQTGFKQKVPIPINPDQNLCALPTHSTTDFECCWLFGKHIHSITPFTDTAHPDKQTKILFLNGRRLLSDVSCYTLRKQLGRSVVALSGVGGVDKTHSYRSKYL